MKQTISNDKDASFINEMKNKFVKMHDDMMANGYVEEFNQMAKDLLAQKKILPLNAAWGLAPKGLKKSLEEIPIAFDYKPIPLSIYTSHIGFGEMGVYRKVEEGYKKEGWTGIGEMFVKDNLICSYYEHNTKLAHGGNELVEEFISYKIHNKPTVELVKGSKDSGYSYKITWYTKDVEKCLECANKMYTKEISENVIALANDIDSK